MTADIFRRGRGADAAGAFASDSLLQRETGRLIPLRPTRRRPSTAKISSRLHQDVEYIAVLVHSAPQILPASVECHEQLVEMPRVAQPAARSPLLWPCSGSDGEFPQIPCESSGFPSVKQVDPRPETIG